LLHPDGRIKDFSTEELFAWFEEARNKHKERLDTAGEIGTIAHNALEEVILYAIANTGGIVQQAPVVKPPEFVSVTADQLSQAQHSADSAYGWMKAHKVVWIATEKKIFSREYHFTGTLDGDAIVNSCEDRYCRGCQGRTFTNRRAIIDFKTSNQLSSSYSFQTAAYLFALLEEFEALEINDRWVLRLGKTQGDFESWYLPSDTFEADLTAFLNALQLYRSLNQIEGRRSAERRAFTASVRAEKKAAKAAAEELEKAQKAEARAALKAARAQWDAESKAFYKNLRAQKIPKAEAELQTEAAFPKANRPGAKEETAPTPAPVSTAVVPKGKWSWKP
jgi:hypothetical protein